MRTLFAPFAAATLIAVAAPAHADPGVDGGAADASFLASLRAAGISYNDPNQVISAAQTVCGLIGKGESGLQVLKDLKTTNPAITTDGAAEFAALSAKFYCPQQLTPSDGGAK
ncbi:DUF732 domain-containing protein [Mycobacterium talmoniae]|uniref:DUF732 domain-containing protein n=1 Tax=Mycobacterium talmoniae TaxID=1858794 RepID=A0A1S1NPX6_9MYCO|nr:MULTISPECIES: DUF732 domain-containing protein [Mycobacterium]OHV06545.1 hypothetical protein BKN37_01930 [Mycobacterium talmoniae]PQM46199.1 hypothetical protein C1Y40_03636 [Mycobacterium talmoniae]TDH56082.1 DUF732 domain-containing protein [Mycobacterium eburneum]